MQRRKGIFRVLDRRGSSAVEFALTLPILILLFMGTVEFSFYFVEENMLLNAVRDGARYGARVKDTTLTTSYTDEQIDTLLATTSTSNPCANCVTVSTASGSSFTSITVAATVAYPPVTGFPVPGVPQELRASATFAMEGPPP